MWRCDRAGGAAAGQALHGCSARMSGTDPGHGRKAGRQGPQPADGVRFGRRLTGQGTGSGAVPPFPRLAAPGIAVTPTGPHHGHRTKGAAFSPRSPPLRQQPDIRAAASRPVRQRTGALIYNGIFLCRRSGSGPWNGRMMKRARPTQERISVILHEPEAGAACAGHGAEVPAAASGRRAARVRLSAALRLAQAGRRGDGDQPHLPALTRGWVNRPQTPSAPRPHGAGVPERDDVS